VVNGGSGGAGGSGGGGGGGGGSWQCSLGGERCTTFAKGCQVPTIRTGRKTQHNATIEAADSSTEKLSENNTRLLQSAPHKSMQSS
jgi:hypothetical protein